MSRMSVPKKLKASMAIATVSAANNATRSRSAGDKSRVKAKKTGRLPGMLTTAIKPANSFTYSLNGSTVSIPCSTFFAR